MERIDKQLFSFILFFGFFVVFNIFLLGGFESEEPFTAFRVVTNLMFLSLGAFMAS